MGAEFCYLTLPAATISKKHLAELIEFVQSRSITDLQEVADRIGDDISDPQTLQAARDNVICALKEVADPKWEDRRDVNYFSQPGLPFDLYIVGGDSFGDDPSDAYGTIQTIIRCEGLYEKLEAIASSQCRRRGYPVRTVAACNILRNALEEVKEVGHAKAMGRGKMSMVTAALKKAEELMTIPGQDRER